MAVEKEGGGDPAAGVLPPFLPPTLATTHPRCANFAPRAFVNARTDDKVKQDGVRRSNTTAGSHAFRRWAARTSRPDGSHTKVTQCVGGGRNTGCACGSFHWEASADTGEAGCLKATLCDGGASWCARRKLRRAKKE